MLIVGNTSPGDWLRTRVLALTFSSPVFSSTYKDSNTLHLPTERFSPVRRFSDGAASIQAFKAHLEKMGTSSSIKQLQQVMERCGHRWRSMAAETASALLSAVVLLDRSRAIASCSLPACYVQLRPASASLAP